MATIVTRETTQTDGTSPKGSPLTNAEVDTNFINLNDDKVEVSGAIIFQAQAGEALAKGDVVYVSGVSGNTPVVSKADADDANKMPAYGLAEDAANLNAAVNVVTFGTLYELDTSSFSAGDTVYVSTTAGALTNSAPTGESSLIQNIGMVVRSHASAGSIKVGGAGRTNATPNLNDGNVFIGNASNQVEARALTGDDISGGTITSFASTGIDDNAVSTAITIDSSQDVTFTSDAKFPDNGKAIFGAGSDLEILSNGTTALVKAGNATSDIRIESDNRIVIADRGFNETFAVFNDDSDVKLFYDNAEKLATTSTGIDVTGDVNSDSVTTGTFTSTGIDDNATSTKVTVSDTGIDVTGNVTADDLDVQQAGFTSVLVGSTNAGGSMLVLDGDSNGDGTGADYSYIYHNAVGQLELLQNSPAGTNEMLFKTAGNNLRMKIGSGGDISFYEDTGTTQAFFWDASTSRLGIGTTSPSSDSIVKFLHINDATSSGLVLQGAKKFSVYSSSSSSLIFRDETAGTNRITLDSSGNVGIGTTSPDGKLNVVKGTASGTTASTSANNIVIDGTSGTETGMTLFSTVASGIRFGDASGASQGVIEYGHATDYMRFVVNAAERMRIDSSGNVTIDGSDASTSLASTAILNLKAGDANNEYSILRFATSADGSIGYIGAKATTTGAYPSSVGNLEFGVQNGASTVTAMTINNSGNVGIGGSISTAKLYVVGATNDSTQLAIRAQNLATSDVFFVRNDGSMVAGIGSKMTLDASGNLGIGTTSPANTLDILGDTYSAAFYRNVDVTQIGPGGSFIQIGCRSGSSRVPGAAFGALLDNPATTGAAIIQTRTGGALTEKMRIDTSGNLLVGTTVTPAYGVMNLKNPADAARWQVGPNEFGNFVVYNQSTVGVYLTDGGTSWTGTSDERLKENINDIGPVLETIKNYQCVNFSYKANQSKKANSIGFIAQDWENDFPNVIETDDNDYLGIKYTETIPVLLRAIQEQQAMIETLQAQVAELQGA